MHVLLCHPSAATKKEDLQEVVVLISCAARLAWQAIQEALSELSCVQAMLCIDARGDIGEDLVGPGKQPRGLTC